MNIKDLTEQQLQELIRFTVDETLDQYFGDPDQGKEIKAAFKQNFLEIQQKRRVGRATIPAEEVYKRYGITDDGILPRPALTFPIESYSDERIKEFEQNNEEALSGFTFQ